MKKVVASAAVALVALVALGAPAGAQGGKTYFDGTTKQGKDLFFIIEDIGGVPTFEPFFTTFSITCNGVTFDFSWFFIGFQIPLDDSGFFEIDLPGDQLPFNWQGTVSGNNARGVQSQGYAAYAPDGGVVDCGTGPVGWRAVGVGGQAPAGGADWTATVTRQQDGKITQTITNG